MCRFTNMIYGLFAGCACLLMFTVSSSAVYAGQAEMPAIDLAAFSSSVASESIESLNAKAWKCVEKERYDSAAAYYSVAASRYSESLSREDKKRCAVANINLGYVWLSWRMNAPEAYPLLMRARRIARNEGFDDIESYVLSNLGQIYFDYSNVAKGAELHREALMRIIDAGKDRYIGQNLIDYISAALSVDSLDMDALKKDICSIATHQLSKNVELYDYSQGLIDGLELLASGDEAGAAATIEKIVSKFDLTVEKDRYLSLHYLISARLWMMAGDYEKAMKQLTLMLSTAAGGGYVNLSEKGYAYMVKCCRELGLGEKMTEYQDRAVHIRDSLFNASRFEVVKDMEIAGELQSLHENVRLASEKAEIERQRMIWVGVTCVVLLIAIVLILIWHRRLRMAYKEIFKRNMELSTMRPQYPMVTSCAASQDIADNSADSADNQAKTPEDFDRNTSSKILESVLDVMECNRDIFDSDFSVDRLAVIVGRRPKQVSQAINAIAGKNFNVLLGEYRVREACRILADPESLKSETMDSIAERVGYKSRTYFSKVFKNVTGLTPTQFAKQSK